MQRSLQPCRGKCKTAVTSWNQRAQVEKKASQFLNENFENPKGVFRSPLPCKEQPIKYFGLLFETETSITTITMIFTLVTPAETLNDLDSAEKPKLKVSALNIVRKRMSPFLWYQRSEVISWCICRFHIGALWYDQWVRQWNPIWIIVWVVGKKLQKQLKWLHVKGNW